MFALGDLAHQSLVLTADRGLAQGGHEVAAELAGEPRRDRATGQEEDAGRGIHLERIDPAPGTRACRVDDERVDGHGAEAERRGQAGPEADARPKVQGREDDENVIAVGRRGTQGPVGSHERAFREQDEQWPSGSRLRSRC